MSTVLEADPEVRRAIEQLHGSMVKERRRVPRESFPVVQRIAQATDGKIPEHAAFSPVKCHDLSTRGFSFIVKKRPQFKAIVLALAAPPDVIYLAAEVRHCTDVLMHASGRVEALQHQGAEVARESRSGQGAEPVVLVGCEFTERLRSHAS
jgi:hypothetical protein